MVDRIPILTGLPDTACCEIASYCDPKIRAVLASCSSQWDEAAKASAQLIEYPQMQEFPRGSFVGQWFHLFPIVDTPAGRIARVKRTREVASVALQKWILSKERRDWQMGPNFKLLSLSNTRMNDLWPTIQANRDAILVTFFLNNRGRFHPHFTEFLNHVPYQPVADQAVVIHNWVTFPPHQPVLDQTTNLDFTDLDGVPKHVVLFRNLRSFDLALIAAAQVGQVETVDLLRNAPRVTEVAFSDAFKLAAQNRHPYAVGSLAHGAKRIYYHVLQNVARWAISPEGDLDVFSQLVRSPREINVRKLLENASASGTERDLDVVATILNSDRELSLSSPLSIAAENGHVKTVRKILGDERKLSEPSVAYALIRSVDTRQIGSEREILKSRYAIAADVLGNLCWKVVKEDLDEQSGLEILQTDRDVDPRFLGMTLWEAGQKQKVATLTAILNSDREVPQSWINQTFLSRAEQGDRVAVNIFLRSGREIPTDVLVRSVAFVGFSKGQYRVAYEVASSGPFLNGLKVRYAPSLVRVAALATVAVFSVFAQMAE